MFKKLHLLVLRSFIAPFVAGFSVALFILTLQFLAMYQDDLFGKGFGGAAIAQIFMYAALQLVTLAIPIAMLIASLMTLGQLGERYELAAMKSAGIHLFRIILPLIVTACLLGLGSFWYASNVVPQTNLKLYSLLFDFKKSRTQFVLQPGYFDRSIPGYAIYFPKRNEQTGTIYNVKVWDHRRGQGNATIVFADSATVTNNDSTLFLVLTLYHGKQHDKLKPDPKKPNANPYAITSFDTAVYKIDMSSFQVKRTEERFFQNHRYMMSAGELREAADSMAQVPKKIRKEVDQQFTSQLKARERLSRLRQSQGETNSTSPPVQQAEGPQAEQAAQAPSMPLPYALSLFRANLHGRIVQSAKAAMRSNDSYLNYARDRYNTEHKNYRRMLEEMHYKYMLPFAVVLFLFIGAPLGAIIRKGGLGLPVVVAIGFFVIFYLLMAQGKKMERALVLQVWAGVWLPIMVLLPVALYLTYQAATDARLLDTSAWKMRFQGLLAQIKRLVGLTKNRDPERGRGL